MKKKKKEEKTVNIIKWNKKLSDPGREDFKRILGITTSPNNKKCSNCEFFYRQTKLCNIHNIKVEYTDLCKNHGKVSKIKVYKGGRTSPK